ncbi:MAG: LptA/OstA family protein [Victivallaceae bacterium]|nr:LptA/OstA family protein [Victivallaceae bacterium]
MKRAILLMFLLAAVIARGDDNFDSLKGLSLANAKIPVYQGDSLQMMIFADRGKRDGSILRGEGIVLDMIPSHADVDLIGDGWKSRAYKLGAPLTEIVEFWKKRRTYSEGVMTTPRGDVDQKGHRAFGNEKVYFRSPTIDLNGIGFVADFKRHTIQVNTDVDIILRGAGCDPIRILAGAPMPAEYRYMTATSDSLLIDNDRDQVLLVGSVHVKEQETTLDSERLTIFLNSSDTPEAGGEEALVTSSTGISHVLADGSVVMRDGKEQRAFADHLRYDMDRNIVTLTSDAPRSKAKKRQVRLLSLDPVSGKAMSTLESDVAVFYRNDDHAVFTGEVKVQDGSGELLCDRLELFFSPAQKQDSDRVIGGSGGSQKLERAVAIGNVRMKDPKSTLECNIMTLYFSGGGRDPAEAETVSGLLHTGQSRLNRIVCEGDVRGATLGESAKAGEMFGPLGGGGRSGRRFSTDILVSDQVRDFSELHGDVCMRDDETKLECEEMFIFGKPKTEIVEEEDPDADPFAILDSESYAPSRVLIDSDSELDKIVCERNVRVTNGKNGGKRSRAEGDHGLYRVVDKRFTITADPGQYCRIRSDGRIQRCERIHYELERERFIGESSPSRAVYSEIDKEPIPEL